MCRSRVAPSGRGEEHWQDTIYLAGFWAPGSCSAVRRRKSPLLLVPGELLVTDQVEGDALNVLNTVVTRWTI